MTSQQIQLLTQILPADGPYYQLAFRTEPHKLRSSSLAQRLSLALSDPAFAWNVASSYSTAGVILPEWDWPLPILRAYEFLQCPDVLDPNVALAYHMNLPEKRSQRDVLRAALICPDLTLEQLAERFRICLDMLGLFESLFWNCRDRIGDRLYIAQLCQQPGLGRIAGVDSDYRGRDLLAVAYWTGRTELVFAAADLAPFPGKASPSGVLSEEILRAILGNATAVLRTGFVNRLDNPLLEPALRIIATQLQDRAFQSNPVQGLTAEQAIRMTLQRILNPQSKTGETSAQNVRNDESPPAP